MPITDPLATSPLALHHRVNAWRELLDQCGRKPTRKRVHALRVVTLRIQAELEHEIAGLPHAGHQAQAILRFGKLADKLRQTLGRVRELDDVLRWFEWLWQSQRTRCMDGLGDSMGGAQILRSLRR